MQKALQEYLVKILAHIEVRQLLVTQTFLTTGARESIESMRGTISSYKKMNSNLTGDNQRKDTNLPSRLDSMATLSDESDENDSPFRINRNK